MNQETRACERCKGEGTVFRKGFEWEGKVYPDKTEVCSRCKGTKVFSAPDCSAILETITTARGMKDGKRKFRTAFPQKLNKYADINHARAYYVWRLARFHGGKDVTMPVMAGVAIGGDPFQKELDIMAEQVAKHAFGTDLAGVYRWGALLGFADPNKIPDNLPSTAYELGPVKEE